MASKKKSAKGKKPAAKAKSSGKPDKTKGDHVRMLANKSAVRSFITEIIASKNETSTLGQEISSATKRAQNAGINIPAARLAVRFVSKAKMDAGAARVMFEDFTYYLNECMEFDKIAPPGMFKPDEVRSTKAGSAKRNPRKGEQTDIEDVASQSTADETTEETASAAATAEEAASAAVH